MVTSCTTGMLFPYSELGVSRAHTHTRETLFSEYTTNPSKRLLSQHSLVHSFVFMIHLHYDIGLVHLPASVIRLFFASLLILVLSCQTTHRRRKVGSIIRQLDATHKDWD